MSYVFFVILDISNHKYDKNTSYFDKREKKVLCTDNLQNFYMHCTYIKLNISYIPTITNRYKDKC